MTAKTIKHKLTRREMLGVMGAAAGAAAVAACGGGSKGSPATSTPAAATSTAISTGAATATPGASALSCVVSPALTEGPYFVDEMLNRSDIRSDPVNGAVKEGLPLRLAISVQNVNGNSCTPVTGAHIDVWHCDAVGLYSDVQQNHTVGQKFLRGYQLTDEGGAVEFTTIYPGWYMGRAVHIHMKVRTDPTSQQGYEFTSQLFFDESVTDQVHARPPYSSHGQRDTMNGNDNIYQSGGAQMMPQLSPEGQGYLGTIAIGVQTA